MLPKHARILRLRISEELSEETLAFTAELHLYGKLAADVRNDGRGGAHLLRFHDPVMAADFKRTVAAWAIEHNVTLEPADRLINALIDRCELSAAARAFARRERVGRVVCIRKSPVRLDSEPDGYPLGFEQDYLLALPEGLTASELARREGADTYLSFTFGQSWLPAH